MKKLCVALIAAIFISILTFSANATGTYYADGEGSYTIEIDTGVPDTEFAIIIVAGDYTAKEVPEITEENMIYLDQARSDSEGIIKFTDFIPMTGSVGTIFISGEVQPTSEGLLMTDSGLGYIAGKLISYSGDDETVILTDEITEIGEGIFADSDVKRLYLTSSVISVAQDILSSGIDLLLSPNASNTIKSVLSAAEKSYYILGDYDRNGIVNSADLDGILNHFAQNTPEPQNFHYYFDLNLDGKVSLYDITILLRYLAGALTDFI